MSDERKEFLLKWLNTWVVTGGEVGPEEEKAYQLFCQLIKKHEGNDEEFLIPAQAKAIYDTLDDPHKDGGTKLIWLENYLNRIIQQQPKIDDMTKYIYEKAEELYDETRLAFPLIKQKAHWIVVVAQIISDVRGEGIGVDEAFINEWGTRMALRGFSSKKSSRDLIRDILKKAGVKIK